MFVKVYQYHIQKEKVHEYLSIQEKASEIYGRYLDFNIIYLQSKDDSTKWMEVSKYKDEEEYQKSIDLIKKEKELQELFGAFQSLLVNEKQEIIEENFLEKKVLSNY